MTAPSPGSRVLVVASTLPPMVGGTAKMMRNLFSPVPKDSLVFLRGNNELYKSAQDSPLTNVEIADMPNFLRRRSFRIELPAYLEYLWTPWIAWRIHRIARREGVRAIFGNYPFGYFLVAAWMASRLSGLPLFVYMNDLWEETQGASMHRFAARFLERRFFRDAAAVYVITQYVIDHYREKHGIEARLLPHAVDFEDAVPAGAARATSAGKKERTILFAGGVYKMNLDALQKMVEAVEGMPPLSDGTEARFLLCTPNDPEVLKSLRLSGSKVDIRFVDTRTLIELQRDADLLYLPLAFETPWQLEVKTVYPTKAVEYLISGTPIQLHAPPDCYTVHEARKYGWAHIVDRQDAELLREAIRQALTDEPLRAKLVEGARTAAAVRDARKLALGLQKDLGII